ncbi:hypothetical protein BJ742DRAFT_328161 [Cladochytrium replicatum]|nr:hypothetical protein BJ742DRAFT_328161 [Cladochytrium replicatum]
MNLFLEGLAALLELLIMVFDSPANGGAGIDPAAAVAGIWDADHQLPPSALHLSSGSGATDTPVQLPFTEWKVQNIWPASRGFGFYVGERRSLAQVLVERSRIPPDILKAKDEEMGRTNSSDKPRNDPFVLMLYNDGLMLLFDLERHFEGSYAIGIIRSKWDMVLAMVSVASLFIINEIRQR